MTWSEVVELAGGLDDLLDPWITKLNNITGIHVYQMVVLHAAVGLFELCYILSELMFDNQAAIEQQFNGVLWITRYVNPVEKSKEVEES